MEPRTSADNASQVIEMAAIDTSTIATIAAGVDRPLISVIVPVYRPDPSQLHRALQSVLSQDMGASKMQIAIVDDASPNTSMKVESLVRQVDPEGRIEIFRNSRNQGLAGCWNQCIRIARGEIVHLLHQDDWVDNGFYQRLMPGFSQKRVGMAFCRYAIVEGEDRIVRVSHRESWRAGVLKNWLNKIAECQRIQCPSVMVPRRVYEQLGGYRSDLQFALDWEMWVRIAAKYDVWYQPKRLAYYRRHAASETQRLNDHQQSDMDVLKAIDVFANHLPATEREAMKATAYTRFVQRAIKRTKKTTLKPQAPVAELLDYLQCKVESLPSLNATTKHLAKQVSELNRLLRL
jgi:glycosyltransferase involved in cell wall biosynthesis